MVTNRAHAYLEHEPMEKITRNYVRTHRKRSGLSQRDLAFLLGLQSSQMISRYEKSIRTPSLKIIIAASLLFDAPPGDLFPGLAREVELLLISRAKTLAAASKTKHISDPVFSHKRDFLLSVLVRLEARDNE